MTHLSLNTSKILFLSFETRSPGIIFYLITHFSGCSFPPFPILTIISALIYFSLQQVIYTPSCPDFWRYHLLLFTAFGRMLSPFMQSYCLAMKKTFWIICLPSVIHDNSHCMSSNVEKSWAELWLSHQLNKQQRKPSVHECLWCWGKAWPPQIQVSSVLSYTSGLLAPNCTIHSRFMLLQGKDHLTDSCLKGLC